MGDTLFGVFAIGGGLACLFVIALAWSYYRNLVGGSHQQDIDEWKAQRAKERGEDPPAPRSDS